MTYNFTDRGHVEAVGRFGVAQERDAAGLRAKQLNNFWLYVDEEDSGYTKHALGDGFWESWITLWMDHNVPEGGRCLDIGANHGYYSFYLATAKNAEVYAVEPQPSLAQLIRNSEAVNRSGVTVIEAAVSDKDDDVVDMMVPIHHGMNATISNQYSYAPDGYTNIKVPTFTLDSQIGFDFIKVDAEGAEDLIWAGSEEYRRDNPDTLWLMEWRWDRYKDPAGFANELFKDHEVSHVAFDGSEQRIHMSAVLAGRQHEDWMLVLRKR